MKIFKTFAELKNAPSEIYKYFLEMENNEPPAEDMDLIDWYGGYINIIESIEDLAEVPTCQAVEDDSRWYNILEKPDGYDACRWIDTEQSYVEIFIATTDAGGPSFFVPKEIALKVPNVIESMKMSNEVWS